MLKVSEEVSDRIESNLDHASNKLDELILTSKEKIQDRGNRDKKHHVERLSIRDKSMEAILAVPEARNLKDYILLQEKLVETNKLLTDLRSRTVNSDSPDYDSDESNSLVIKIEKIHKELSDALYDFIQVESNARKPIYGPNPRGSTKGNTWKCRFYGLI